MNKKSYISTFFALVILFSNVSFSIASAPIKGSIKTSNIAQYAPKWEEFCPQEYLHSEYKQWIDFSLIVKNFTEKPPQSPNPPSSWIYGWIPYCFTPSGRQYLREEKNYPIKLEEFSAACDRYSAAVQPYIKENEKNLVGNYWYQRRKAFDSEIKLCLADKNTASACFMQVRQLEEYKNAQKNNKELQLAQQTQQAEQFEKQQRAQEAQFREQQAAQQAALNAQIMMQSVNNAQSQIQSMQMNNNLNNINSSINNFNNNVNKNSNTTNSNLHAINHNLNRINKALH